MGFLPFFLLSFSCDEDKADAAPRQTIYSHALHEKYSLIA
jgi:hypothetical protein